MALYIQKGKVENFTASRETGWYAVKFSTPFPDNTVPVISAQLQTRNGGDTPGVRLQKVSNTGFEVIMDEVIMSGTTSSKVGDLGKVQSDGVHPYAETLGWIAVV